MAAMDPGRLRHRLALQQAVRTPNGLGGAAESWTTIATVFAHVEPLRAANLVRADKDTQTVTHRVMLRWRDGVEIGRRFAWGERVLAIVTAHDPDGSGRFLECLTRETAS